MNKHINKNNSKGEIRPQVNSSNNGKSSEGRPKIVIVNEGANQHSLNSKDKS